MTRYLRHADGRESWTTMRPRNTAAAVRVNQYAGPCAKCRENVAPCAGRLGDKVNGRWTVAHNVCPAVEAEEAEFMARARARAEADRAASLARIAEALGVDPSCGTTGCEAHDGECRDNWAGMRI